MSVRDIMKKSICLIGILLLAVACQPVIGTSGPRPAAVPTVKKEPKVALVLGGGSAKGFAHVGVIRDLEQKRFRSTW
jgi:NTE family protein